MSSCLTIYSLQSQYNLVVGQEQLQPNKLTTRQKMWSRKWRNWYFLSCLPICWSSGLNRQPPIRISKEQLLKRLTKKRQIAMVPKRPPMQERISSIFWKLRSISMEMGDLQKQKVAQSGDGSAASLVYLFLMQVLVIMPPLSTFSAERGMMLSSVVMVQSSTMSWHSSPSVAENMMQLASSRQWLRNSGESELMRGLMKQRVQQKLPSAAKRASIQVSVAQGWVKEVEFEHLLIEIYKVLEMTEEYLPWIGRSRFLGRQSQKAILRRSKPSRIAGYSDQCSLVQGSRGMSRELLLYSPVSRWACRKLMSKYLGLAFRSWCQISTPNMKGLPGMVEMVQGTGSSALVEEKLELIMTLSKVSTTLLQKVTRSRMMMLVERTPPKRVLYSGSSRYLSNYAVQKKSSLQMTPLILLRKPISF